MNKNNKTYAPKTSYPIRESRELAKMDGCVLSAPRKIFIFL